MDLIRNKKCKKSAKQLQWGKFDIDQYAADRKWTIPIVAKVSKTIFYFFALLLPVF